jgi:putative ABC transport system permease protein
LVPTIRNQNNTRDLKVCGIFKDVGSFSAFSAFANKNDVIEIYQLDPNTTGFIMVFLKNTKKVEDVNERLRNALEKSGNLILERDPVPFWMKFEKIANQDWIGEKLDISTWEDNLSFVKWIVQSINGISVLLVTVILISIALGITNALGMAVRERTAEIGTLRAIGMQRGGILRLFLLEGLVLSTLSATLGVVFAWVTAFLINHWAIKLPDAFEQVLIMDTLQFDMRLGAAIFSVIMVTIFTIAGSLYPAWRASRMQPVTALSHAQ